MLTLTEMVDAVWRMADAVDLPVFADGDNGHGNTTNVARTVKQFEKAGAATIMLEDQVSPKRCGHMSGKHLVPADEFVAKIRAAEASLKQARSDYLPSLTFSGLGGLQRGYGQQDLLPGTYASGETWNVQLNLQWTLFDGARRENTIAEAKAKRTQAKAELDAARDQISNEVWTAYSNLKTAQRQRQAAAALLASADRSFGAALRSYDLGLRSLLDVVAAQKALAQARSSDVSARTQVLTQISNLAFRTADLLRAPAPKIGPQP